jgi:uncharacterized protein
MKYGLSESIINKICAVFVKYPQIDQAIIYGSRAKGNFRNGSDIDLTLQSNSLTFPLLNKIANELDELLLPYIIDLSIYNNIADTELLAHIKRAGISFYKRRPAKKSAVA